MSDNGGRFKLYYFNLRGRAETIRLIMASANFKYQDIRFTQEEWISTYKKMSPSGQSPFLECPDGKILVQSGAILRHLGKKFNLMGKNDTDYYKIEWVLAQVKDVATELSKVMFASPEKKEKIVKEFYEVNGPVVIQPLVDFIPSNPPSFVTGDSLTVADLELMSATDQLKGQHPLLYRQFPSLQAHYDLVLKSNPGVAQHVKTRPQTLM